MAGLSSSMASTGEDKQPDALTSSSKSDGSVTIVLQKPEQKKMKAGVKIQLEPTMEPIHEARPSQEFRESSEVKEVANPYAQENLTVPQPEI